jgi:type IX secretion system PorP/SprF family membrane protein
MMHWNFHKRIIIVIIISLLGILKGLGQQDPGFTQFIYNTQIINPSYAGTTETFDVVLLSRHQWVGFHGAPTTQTFSAHTPLRKKNLGLGFSYVRDRIGPLNMDNINLDYSYKVRLNSQGILSMGLKTGIDVHSNNLLQLNPLEPNDPSYDHNIEDKISYNFGAGFYYYTPAYFLGISMPRLRRSGYNNALYLQQRHLYIIGGYNWILNESWTFKSSFLTRYVSGAPVSLDLNLSTIYREIVMAGLSHRFGSSAGLMLHIRAYRQLWVGYAFDFTTAPIRSPNRGTHEVLLLFNL